MDPVVVSGIVGILSALVGGLLAMGGVILSARYERRRSHVDDERSIRDSQRADFERNSIPVLACARAMRDIAARNWRKPADCVDSVEMSESGLLWSRIDSDVEHSVVALRLGSGTAIPQLFDSIRRDFSEGYGLGMELEGLPIEERRARRRELVSALEVTVASLEALCSARLEELSKPIS